MRNIGSISHALAHRDLGEACDPMTVARRVGNNIADQLAGERLRKEGSHVVAVAHYEREIKAFVRFATALAKRLVSWPALSRSRKTAASVPAPVSMPTRNTKAKTQAKRRR